jgi:23S rRNA (uracil1939-C5)-methyltransferase
MLARTEEYVEVEITDLAYEGKGVGKKDGFVYFVPKTAPGDIVAIDIIQQKKNFADGSVSEILKKSPLRIDPPCPYYNDCGGCHYMHLPYDYQKELKRTHIIKALERIGRIPNPSIESTVQSPQELNYRNRSIFHFKDGKIGYIGSPKQDLVDIKKCLICNVQINEALRFVRERFRDFQQINHLLIKTTQDPKSISFVFSVKSSIRDEALTIFKESRFDTAVSVFESFTPTESSLIFGYKYDLICGSESTEERIDKFKFELSPLSFFQVNTEQAKSIIRILTDDHEKDFLGKKVLELYSGVGLFSIPVSKIAGEVTAIESSRQAVLDASRNCKLNCANNIKTIEGKVREESYKLAKNGDKFDVVLLDPPRQGADRKLLENITMLNPEMIFYISCSPPTLARDLRYLVESGYRLSKVIPVDMFPQTYHIESVSILQKR